LYGNLLSTSPLQQQSGTSQFDKSATIEVLRGICAHDAASLAE
jgi:hypothetical protein